MQNVKQLEDVALAGIPLAIVVRVLLTRIEDEGTVVEAVGDTVPLGVGDVVPAGAAQAKTPSAFPRRAWSGSHDISAHAMPSNSGSIRYQTAAPSLCEHDGGRNSPISRVAARVSSTALKGRAEMTVASRQRSLA